MREPEQPSPRLVEQRIRNRAIESIEVLSEGDEGVRSVGVGEYVNQFFDIIDDDISWGWREWSTFTPEEVDLLDKVHGLLKEACRQTPQVLTDDDFIASCWPTLIQPTARRALNLMTTRGRFREDIEEEQPTEHHD
jgi:hypothetical protein